MKLQDYPLPTVNLSCRKCDRRGRYTKAKLIERHGLDVALPDLRLMLATGCPRNVLDQRGTDQCGVMYPDLADLIPRPED
jgi:hypothetical protein